MTLMPLPDTDYAVMNCSWNELFNCWQSLPEQTQYYVANTTHRLAEVDWLARTLDEHVRRGHGPVAQEGILSLQVYLLLTCADTLGHLYASGGVGVRFKGFFRNLPQDARQNLLDNILTWRTDVTEMVNLGLGDAATQQLTYPGRQQVMQILQSWSPEQRLEAIIDFLYIRRNYYTHESEYPQLGGHPNLSVMQAQRLQAPNTATFGEYDRLQPMSDGGNIYFAYYETGDLVATIRWSVVRGLGQVIGRV